MLDGVRLVVAQAGYRVGDVGVQVRASDDADPATGHSDPARCLAGATRAAADPSAIALIGTYESSCTLIALPVSAAARARDRVSREQRPVPGVRAWRATRRVLDPARPDRRRAGNGGDRRGEGARRAPAVRARRPLGARAAHADGARGRGSVAPDRDRRRGAGSPHGHVGAGPRGARAQGPSRLDLDRRRRRPRGRRAAARARAAGREDRVHTAAPIAVLGSDSLYRDGLLRAAGQAAEGIHVTSGFVPPDALHGAGADFVDAFARPFGEPGLYTAYAADAARLVLAALRRSPPTRAGRAEGALPHPLVPGPDREGRDQARRDVDPRAHRGLPGAQRQLPARAHARPHAADIDVLVAGGCKHARLQSR